MDMTRTIVAPNSIFMPCAGNFPTCHFGGLSLVTLVDALSLSRFQCEDGVAEVFYGAGLTQIQAA